MTTETTWYCFLHVSLRNKEDKETKSPVLEFVRQFDTVVNSREKNPYCANVKIDIPAVTPHHYFQSCHWMFEWQAEYIGMKGLRFPRTLHPGYSCVIFNVGEVIDSVKEWVKGMSKKHPSLVFELVYASERQRPQGIFYSLGEEWRVNQDTRNVTYFEYTHDFYRIMIMKREEREKNKRKREISY